jgi:hypothetical protein
MSFTDYTTPASVRALLGISEKEIRDTVVTDTVYLTALLEHLYGLSPTLADDYQTNKADTSRTALQNRFCLLAETVCAYVVAIALIPNLPMSAPQTITDGKAEHTRMANPYENLRDPLTATLDYYTAKLLAAYALVNTGVVLRSAVARTMVTSVGVAPDPVTGA